MPSITIRCTGHKSRAGIFGTLDGARIFARHWFGAHPTYDTQGVITTPTGTLQLDLTGTTFDDLFPRPCDEADCACRK